MSKEDQKKSNNSGDAKILGENVLKLGPLTSELTNLNGMPTKINFELLRNEKDSDNGVVVGRLSLSLRLMVLFILIIVRDTNSRG